MKFNETKNYEGGEAYEPDSSELKLYKLTINNLLENTYYRSDSESLDEVVSAMHNVDTEYLCKLAAYARNEHNLRQISQLLLAEAAGRENNEIVREYAPSVIRRADEPMEVLAAWEMLNGPVTVKRRAEDYLQKRGSNLNSRERREIERLADGTLEEPEYPKLVEAVKHRGRAVSNPLQDGIEEALHNFDEYQFAKYDRDQRQWNMKDVLNVVRPKPRDELREECFRKIIRGEMSDYDDEYLDNPTTWEVVISERGNTREAWEEVLPRMGLFAKIRNLRNLAEHGFIASDIFDESDMSYAENGDIYPFRFYQAYLALEKSKHRMTGAKSVLSQLIHRTVDNVQLDNTLVCVDISGSMRSPLSQKSEMSYMEIACFLGAVMSYRENDVLAFASDIEQVKFGRSDQIFDRIKKIKSRNVGGATNGWKAINWADNSYRSYDQIVMLTDMQIWDSSGGLYTSSKNTVREAYNRLQEHPKLYMVDLSSYGDLTTPEETEGVYNVNGWNEKIIDFIQESQESNPVETVKRYEP